MNLFENTVVTYIHNTTTVFSEKGKVDSTINRTLFGISFCLNGQITYEQNGEKFVSDPNNAMLLPKGATYKIHRDKEGIFLVINFDCAGLDIDKLTVLSVEDAVPYIKYYNLLTKCCSLNKKLKQFELVYTILERLDSEQSRNPLSPILSYIETNLSDSEMTNKFLAQKMGISEVYLRKLFISKLGVSPKQYILDLRIKTAKQMLANTTKTVTEISEKCGFTNVYHFCRIFKTKTGSTPLEYSKSHKYFKI